MRQRRLEDTFNWVLRLLVWPFLVIRDVLHGESSEWYVGMSSCFACPGIILFFFMLLSLCMPWLLFPTPYADEVAIFASFLIYCLIGIIFYFAHPRSTPSLSVWQKNGPW